MLVGILLFVLFVFYFFIWIFELFNCVVLALPKEAPSIEGTHPSHLWGNDLELNCTSPPSYPAADIHWTVNGNQVSV